MKPLSDREDLMVRGGGLVVIGASTGPGRRRLHFPPKVKDLECLTGQPIPVRTDSYLELDLQYGECAVFKCKP
ncbi:MAG: hypothetical protein IJJ33_21030 [Victivallales bacterium]|nr:hypothetical protein [Victivallales bacterium]